uniref:Uncharacterized protein n=1 Tax=Rousettus aegyptiacus TaxID=9407 RepID=A0A7J8H1Y7_ROUAE|nr:hypothetical protein HJG63_011454 [Rousettus aegyptiacus]
MRPLQGGGLWAPAHRAKRLMSHVLRSATCGHGPPRLEEGERTPPRPGTLAREAAAPRSPRQASPALSSSRRGRESRRPHALLASNRGAVFRTRLPSPPISSLPSSNPLSVACSLCIRENTHRVVYVFNTVFTVLCYRPVSYISSPAHIHASVWLRVHSEHRQPGRPLLPSADLAWGLRSRDRRGTVLNKAGPVGPPPRVETRGSPWNGLRPLGGHLAVGRGSGAGLAVRCH